MKEVKTHRIKLSTEELEKRRKKTTDYAKQLFQDAEDNRRAMVISFNDMNKPIVNVFQ